MDRQNLLRRPGLFIAIGAWVFVLLSLASFHPEDPPSHQVWPRSHVQNLCGTVGATLAYYIFFAIGQGIFPMLLFSGVCLALLLFRNRICDLWLRAIGLLLLSVAFAALVHLIRPGSHDSFPEGHGGLLGISTFAFLKNHFNTAGTGLILATSFLVGLLLAADDLVIRAPALIGSAVQTIRSKTPQIGLRVPLFSRLAALPRRIAALVARPATPDNAVAGTQGPPDQARGKDDDEPLRPATVLRQNMLDYNERMPLDQTVNGQQIDLTYDIDEPPPPAVERAYRDASEAPPAEPAIIPPAQQQAVVPPPPIINNLIAGKTPGAPAASSNAAPDAAGSENPAPADAGSENKREIVVRLAQSPKPRQPEPAQPKELGDYHLPTWDALADAEHGFAETQEKYVREKAAALEQALREFSIDAHVTEIDTGPVITMYELSLAPGIKVAQITQLSNDIARALMATSVRIVAPVPGKSTVGIEVPNPQKEKVRLKELMQIAPEARHKMHIPLFLGKDASGEPLVTDLTAMPHCLIAGTTGSGKSVCINTIIMSILYTQRPDMVKLILVDPKVVEMAAFKDIPHLMCPIINDTGRATSVLEWACEKMDERYEILAEAGVRNIAGYNKLTREELVDRFKPSSPDEEAKIPKFLPYILIIIDELADLMITSGKEVEQFVVRLAQKSRAIGIHLILATQRPQANVVTGLIKSNMPSRVAFRVNSRMDSRIVLDQNGADLLLGQGDMLFLPPGCSKPIRAQGTFIDDREMRESVTLVREQAEAQYEPELVQIKSKIDPAEMEKDELFDDAVRIVLETKRGSVSLLQRRLTIGYSRASRLIEMMAASGIVGDYKGSQAREALLTLEQWDAMKAQQQQDQAEGMTV